MKRAALYIRVSTDEQARHGFSLDEQRHDLTEYAHKHGYTIVDTYADEGATARKALKNRHELQRLLSDVRAGLVDVILFIKLDRWFRNVKDYYTVQDILEQYGVDWIATREDYNTNTSAGRLNLNIRLSIAQNESDQTSDRIKFVFDGLRRQKKFVAPRVTYGYKRGREGYEIDQEAAPIVREMFALYLKYQSAYKVTRIIQDKYNLGFTRTKIRYALENEGYIGRMFGVDNYAPAIIDLATFDKVQKLLAIGQRGEKRRKPTVPYLFSGLLFCPSCGHRLNGIKLRQGKKNTHRRGYRCRRHYADYSCDFSSVINENTIEKYLLAHLEERISKYSAALEVRQQDNHKQDIQRRIDSAAARLSRLKDLYVDGCIDRATYDKDFKTLNAELTQATIESQQQGQKIPPMLDNILRQGLTAIYGTLSQEGKAAFWKSIIYRLDLARIEKGRGGLKKLDIQFL